MSPPEQLELLSGPEAEPSTAMTLPAVAPTAEQAEAIDSRDVDVFLEAGAGTGKTTVLVGRYCDAVDLDGVSPEAILAFTFTEKAAAEMKRRVRAELSRRADAAEGERKQTLRAAAALGEGAPISTIHGFCRALLGSHPAAAGIDPRFRVLDQSEANRLAAEAFATALRELARSDDDVIRLATGFRGRLGNLVNGAWRELRNRGIASPTLPAIEQVVVDSELGDEAGDQLQELALGSLAGLDRLLREFGARYERLKSDRSGLDFDDLQLGALALLRENEAIRDACHERYRHVLVDEFQDTSPMQAELVRLVTGEGARLFTVGDEFQAIYGFRGADLDSFRAERDRAATRADSTARLLKLRGSFRSEPDIVAAVNAIGGELLEGFNRLTVGRPPDRDREAGVQLLLVERKGWGLRGLDGRDDEKADAVLSTAIAEAPANRVAEARAIAHRLRKLADVGTIDPAETVVLLRAFTHVEVYAEALERFGLEPYINGGRGYWSSQQVDDGLRLLGCVANPLEDEALIGALASPAAAVSPDGLWILRQIAGRRRHLWPAVERWFGDGDAEHDQGPGDPEAEREAAEWAERMPEADADRLREFHARLNTLRREAGVLPLGRLVERTFSDFGYELAVLTMPGGLARAANLAKLVRLAAEHESHEGRDLPGFLAAAAREGEGEAQAALVAEDHSGVRLMTIHAAKGLEFDTVVVADLGRGLSAGGAPSALQLDFGKGPEEAISLGLQIARAGGPAVRVNGWEAIRDARYERTAEESARLTYVAASRARRQLILCGLFSESDLAERGDVKPSESALARLLPAWGVRGEPSQAIELPAPLPTRGLSGPFNPGRVEVSVIAATAEAATELEHVHDPVSAPREPERGTPPLLELSERGAAAARSLSYAALAAYQRCGYRFAIERVVGLAAPGAVRADATASPPPSPAAERVAFGNAVHTLLEWSARNRFAPPPRARLEAAIAAEGLASERAGDAERQIGEWLASPLLAELAATARPEVPFRLAIGVDTVIRGTIDLLATTSDGTPVIVDYKTGAAHGGDADALGAAYELQRQLYALAVAEATGAETIGTAYVFLGAAADPVRSSFGPAELAAARERIEALVGRVRAGRFEVTDRPGRSLCHDCPAQPNLCIHPPEVTLA